MEPPPFGEWPGAAVMRSAKKDERNRRPLGDGHMPAAMRSAKKDERRRNPSLSGPRASGSAEEDERSRRPCGEGHVAGGPLDQDVSRVVPRVHSRKPARPGRESGNGTRVPDKGPLDQDVSSVVLRVHSTKARSTKTSVADGRARGRARRHAGASVCSPRHQVTCRRASGRPASGAHFGASVVSPLISRYGSSFLNVL